MSPRIGLVLVGLLVIGLPIPGNALISVTLWAVGAIAWRWSADVQRGVSVTWDGPPRVQPDATVTGTLTVENRSRWPVPWLEVDLRLPAAAAEPHAFSFVLRLRGRRRRRFPVAFVAGARGVHGPSELTWTAPDPLGLPAPHGVGTWRGATVIVPRLAPVRRLDLPSRSPLAQLSHPRSLFFDRTALVGLRDYQRGDPLSSVHWPATARVGRLMRTEAERAAARELLVCLDLRTDGYQRRGRPPVAEAAISTAASLLADTMIAARQQAGLVLSWPTRDDGAAESRRWPVRGGDRHLHTMLDTLARIGLHDAVPLDALVQGAVRGLHAGTTVVVVTGIVDETLGPAVAEASRRGLAVVVTSVGSGVEWESRLPTHVAGAHCVAVAADRALQRLPL
ncbi:MAG TPA: DUF58 domain-containing protein [Euzebyales bacterium]